MRRFSRRALLRGAAALGGVAAFSACGGDESLPLSSFRFTATPRPVRVNGAWVALATNQMLWPLGLEAGYFLKDGVDLDLNYVNGSAAALTAFFTGISLAQVAGSAVVSAQATGQDVVMIAGLVNKGVFRVIAAPGINAVTDLKGKTVGITGLGQPDHFVWQTIAKRSGMAFEDFNFTSLNGVSGQVAALKSKTAQAVAAPPPSHLNAIQVGGHEILDTALFDDPDQIVAIAGMRSYLKGNRTAALGVVKATVEAMARWKKDADFPKRVMSKYLNQTDPQFLDVGREAYVDVFPQVPYPSEDAVARAIEEVASQNPKAKDLRPAQMIDRSFVQELETNGFIAQVYR